MNGSRRRANVVLPARREPTEAERPIRPNDITGEIIGAAIEVHRTLGPGLPEALYVHAVECELGIRGLAAEREVGIGVRYRDLLIDPAYRMDLLVEDAVVVEVKAVTALQDIHKAQLRSYLRLAGKDLGLLLNFNVTLLAEGGIVRLVNSFRGEKPTSWRSAARGNGGCAEGAENHAELTEKDN